MKTTGTVSGTLVAGALLAACGGSSSGTTTPPPTAISAAEGVYQGTLAEGSMTVILENAQYFSIYGEIASGRFVAYGLVQGSGTPSNGSFSSANSKDFYKDVPGVDVSLSASYSPNVSFNGTITEALRTSTFTSAPLATSVYNYKTAANLADIAGSWYMDTMRDESFDLNISSTGTVTGSSFATGCTLTGTIQPRRSGQNVFDVSLTFGPAPCQMPGQTASGIGIEFLLADGRHELLIAGTDSTRTNAMTFAGAR
jgi:hypothetical protein